MVGRPLSHHQLSNHLLCCSRPNLQPWFWNGFPLRAEPGKPPPSYAFWLAFTGCYFLALSFTTSIEKLSLASGLPNHSISLFLRKPTTFEKGHFLCLSTQPDLQTFLRTFWYVLSPNYRSDPPDEKLNSALLLSRRTYPKRDF